MQITDISKAKGTRYTIFVDGEYWYILDAEVIADNRLAVGKQVTEAFLDDLKEQAERRKARERALYLLSYRDHSRGELVEKLCRSVREEIAEETADKMQGYGYLNDQAYAEKLARELMINRRYGERRARFEMKKKHLSEEHVIAAIELVLEEQDPLDVLREVVERKYLRHLGDRKGRQKVTNALIRLGHDYSDVRRVLEEYDEYFGEEENMLEE